MIHIALTIRLSKTDLLFENEPNVHIREIDTGQNINVILSWMISYIHNDKAATCRWISHKLNVETRSSFSGTLLQGHNNVFLTQATYNNGIVDEYHY